MVMGFVGTFEHGVAQATECSFKKVKKKSLKLDFKANLLSVKNYDNCSKFDCV